jgi:PAS domain S-box-containing protein
MPRSGDDRAADASVSKDVRLDSRSGRGTAHWKVLLGVTCMLALFAALGLGSSQWLVAHGLIAQDLIAQGLIVLVVLLFGVTVWLGISDLRVRTGLKRLAEEGRGLIDAAAGPDSANRVDALTTLNALQPKIEARLKQDEALLREEAQRRAHAEEQLHQSQERYALAVSGANDGMWEWNSRTKRAYFSPRAKSMLGYAEDEIGDDVAEWQGRVHPDDLPRALTDLQAHMDGHSARFEFEHRMRHKDGSWRWVLARAAAVRHASGKPERLVGLYTDVTTRKQVQQVLLELADGLTGLRGEAAYAALVQQFAGIVGAREVFLSECCNYPATRVRMLAHWYVGQFAPREEFDLSGTPCEEVILGAEPVFVSRGASERWPAELPWGTQAYLGLPCIDSKGVVIGHIACKHGEAIDRELPHQAILRLFAVRASVEMERHLLERMRANTSGQSAVPPSLSIH